MNLSDENKLLLYCSQAAISEKRLSQMDELLSRSLNWKYITEAASSWNIAQLLYQNLKDPGNRGLVPPGVMEGLKQVYHTTVARNMLLYTELRNIVIAFQSAGVKVCVLKGAALAGIVYRDPGLRPMMDLDLLVRKEDLGTVHRVMTDLRYAAAAGSQSKQWYREKHFHLPPYHHPEKPVVVEIHWHITENSFGLDINQLWKRTREVDLTGCRVLVLSPEDMLIHTCIHVYNHGYENAFFFRGLCDIAEIVRYYEAEINWELLSKEIKEHGIEKQVHSLLFLAGEFYELDRYLSAINLDRADHRFLTILKKSLFADQSRPSVLSHFLKSMIFDTFPEKARYLLSRIFPSREEMAKRYPVSASSRMMIFYYLVHPFQLMAKYGRSVIALYRGKAGRGGRE